MPIKKKRAANTKGYFSLIENNNSLCSMQLLDKKPQGMEMKIRIEGYIKVFLSHACPINIEYTAVHK